MKKTKTKKIIDNNLVVILIGLLLGIFIIFFIINGRTSQSDRDINKKKKTTLLNAMENRIKINQDYEEKLRKIIELRKEYRLAGERIIFYRDVCSYSPKSKVKYNENMKLREEKKQELLKLIESEKK